MERFFIEHHVIHDRDPDEVEGHVVSDSEASDEEHDDREGVRSVHDPTGPWRHTPTDASWGEPKAKQGGTKNRFFRSEHTGPKGVIKDYKAHKQYLREERERAERERKETLERIAKGATNQPTTDSGCDGSDCECDDMLVNDEFLQKYNAMRMFQMHENAKARSCFGAIEYITPDDYVKLTDNAAADVMMVVHLYHPESYSCGLMNEHLEEIAKELAHIKFAALVAKDADDSITMKDLPVLLVYRGQQLEKTVLGVSERLNGEFTADRIKQLVLSETASKV